MHFLLTLLFLLLFADASSQSVVRDSLSSKPGKLTEDPITPDQRIDSLRNLLSATVEDSTRVYLWEELGWAYRGRKMIDSAIKYFKKAYQLNKEINYSIKKQIDELATIDYMLYETGNYTESLEYASQEMLLLEKRNDPFTLCFIHLVFAHDYKGLGEYRLSLDEYFAARNCFIDQYTLAKMRVDNAYTDQCIAIVYLKMGLLDSALYFAREGYASAVQLSIGGIILLSKRVFGDIYLAKGDDSMAMNYYRQYIPDYETYHEKNRDLGFVLNSIAGIFQKKGVRDSAIWYAEKALDNAIKFKDQENIYYASKLLSGEYKGKDNQKAFDYLTTAVEAKDGMLGIEKVKQAQVLSYREKVREKENAEKLANERAKRRMIISVFAAMVLISGFLIWNRLRQLRLRYRMILEQNEAEKLKANYEKQIVTLEARALRAQMNPHFIFNCMNSIKSLIQQNENEKAISYLTTFSKLIRTIFQNSDKREISLYDEIETCRLYTQLEGMRFGDKLSFSFNIDQSIDLKSIQLPALIIQPFIENSIWHGIIPKEDNGSLNISVEKNGQDVCCIIDDDGIGREMSKKNKYKGAFSAHESKGVHLTQSRLDIDNLLNERNTEVEITDKRDVYGNAAGTKVTLTFKTA